VPDPQASAGSTPDPSGVVGSPSHPPSDPRPNFPAEDPPALHPAIAHLAPLLGIWRGRGRGHYPTIEPFEYVEELTFSHAGKPFLVHVQRTRSADDGSPLHTETGYWRAVGRDGDGRERIELVVAQPTGVVEVLEGTFDGTTATLRSTTVGRTSTAKEVTALERVYRVRDGQLRYTLAMAAVGQPMTGHLEATLGRDQPPGT
jgi:hypothetical protein